MTLEKIKDPIYKEISLPPLIEDLISLWNKDVKRLQTIRVPPVILNNGKGYNLWEHHLGFLYLVEQALAKELFGMEDTINIRISAFLYNIGHCALSGISDKAILTAAFLSTKTCQEFTNLIQRVTYIRKKACEQCSLNCADKLLSEYRWVELFRWIAVLKLLDAPKSLEVLTRFPNFSLSKVVANLICPLKKKVLFNFSSLNKLDGVLRASYYLLPMSINIDLDAFLGQLAQSRKGFSSYKQNEWLIIRGLERYIHHFLYNNPQINKIKEFFVKQITTLLIKEKLSISKLIELKEEELMELVKSPYIEEEINNKKENYWIFYLYLKQKIHPILLETLLSSTSGEEILDYPQKKRFLLSIQEPLFTSSTNLPVKLILYPLAKQDKCYDFLKTIFNLSKYKFGIQMSLLIKAIFEYLLGSNIRWNHEEQDFIIAQILANHLPLIKTITFKLLEEISSIRRFTRDDWFSFQLKGIDIWEDNSLDLLSFLTLTDILAKINSASEEALLQFAKFYRLLPVEFHKEGLTEELNKKLKQDLLEIFQATENSKRGEILEAYMYIASLVKIPEEKDVKWVVSNLITLREDGTDGNEYDILELSITNNKVILNIWECSVEKNILAKNVADTEKLVFIKNYLERKFKDILINIGLINYDSLKKEVYGEYILPGDM